VYSKAPPMPARAGADGCFGKKHGRREGLKYSYSNRSISVGGLTENIGETRSRKYTQIELNHWMQDTCTRPPKRTRVGRRTANGKQKRTQREKKGTTFGPRQNKRGSRKVKEKIGTRKGRRRSGRSRRPTRGTRDVLSQNRVTPHVHSSGGGRES